MKGCEQESEIWGLHLEGWGSSRTSSMVTRTGMRVSVSSRDSRACRVGGNGFERRRRRLSSTVRWTASSATGSHTLVSSPAAGLDGIRRVPGRCEYVAAPRDGRGSPGTVVAVLDGRLGPGRSSMEPGRRSRTAGRREMADSEEVSGCFSNASGSRVGEISPERSGEVTGEERGSPMEESMNRECITELADEPGDSCH